MNRIDSAKRAGRWGATGSTAGSDADTDGSSDEGGGSGSTGASSVGRGMQVSLQTSRPRTTTGHSSNPLPTMLLSRAACRFAGSNGSGHHHTVTFSNARPARFCSDVTPTVTWLRDDGRPRAYDVNDA
jgi:hypothetical protein